MKDRLTPLQAVVIKTIRQFIEKHGCAPNYRYIAKAVGAKYPQQIANCIDRLCNRGYILKHPHGASYTILRDEHKRKGHFRWQINSEEIVCGEYVVAGKEYLHYGKIIGYDDDGRAIIKSKDGWEMSFAQDEIKLHMGVG